MLGFSDGLRISVGAAVAVGALYLAAALPILVRGDMGGTVVLASALLGFGLVLLTAIDIACFRLPDGLTLPLVAAGLAVAALLDLQPDVFVRTVAAVAAFGTIWLIGRAYQWIRGQLGIGMGDAKLFAVAGAWLGPDGLPATLLFACAAGLAYAGIQVALGKPMSRNEAIAFGPFLAGAIWIVWLYGAPL